jgi:hypothetical protein
MAEVSVRWHSPRAPPSGPRKAVAFRPPAPSPYNPPHSQLVNPCPQRARPGAPHARQRDLPNP